MDCDHYANQMVYADDLQSFCFNLSNKLKKIEKQLDDIDPEDLTTAEKNILKILESD